jgi:ribosomal-protein-alanine N-acetyltransferase
MMSIENFLAIQIRRFNDTDLEKVVSIEAATQVSPWSDAAFLRCWNAKYPGWVVEVDGEIVGFVFISLASGECHVLNLCIHTARQRLGLGRQLLTSALMWAKEQGAGIVYLEVRRSNINAIALYRNMNFKSIGERKSYYSTPKGPEDAVVFARDLGIEGEKEI